MKIRFVTKNPHKAGEVGLLLRDANIEIIHAPLTIHEIQSESIDDIVKDKILKAFKLIGRPVIVEHTGLYIDNIDGFPGGLTQVFWDKLKADKFSQLFGNGDNTSLTAKTLIGYCDAKTVRTFEGEIRGTVAPVPRGDRSFQWDCIFVPDGYSQTFAELGDRKNDISMRKMAFDKFKDYIGECA